MNRLAPIVAALVVLAAACGGDGDGTRASSNARTVEIAMSDIAFAPDEVEIAAGETVRFVFENDGAVAHDAFIGDKAAQADHAEEMVAALRCTTTETARPSPSIQATAVSSPTRPARC